MLPEAAPAVPSSWPWSATHLGLPIRSGDASLAGLAELAQEDFCVMQTGAGGALRADCGAPVRAGPLAAGREAGPAAGARSTRPSRASTTGWAVRPTGSSPT